MAKNKQPMYGYTINSSGDPTLDDQSGEKFDEKGLRYNRAQLVTATQPDRKAMRYLGMEDESKMNLGEDFDINKAGAGRAGRCRCVPDESTTSARRYAAFARFEVHRQGVAGWCRGCAYPR